MANTWTAFQRENDYVIQQKEKEANDAIVCGGCGSHYFTQVEAGKYRSNAELVVGQRVPNVPSQHTSYMLLQCVRCGDYTEPNVIRHNPMMLEKDAYTLFLDTLHGEGDTRVKAEDPTTALKAEISTLQTELENLKKTLETNKSTPTSPTKKSTKKEQCDSK